MTFRDGLMRARGQIAFVLALALSTAAIIYLEHISAQETLDRQLAERLAAAQAQGPAQGGPSGVEATPQTRQQALLALAQADVAPEADEGRALSLATALSAAHLSGGLDNAEAAERARGLWAELSGDASSEAASARALLVVVFPGIEGGDGEAADTAASN